MLEKIENELRIINYSKSLKELADDTLLLLKVKIIEYEKLFGFSNENKIVINYFDNINDFRNFIYEIRGEKQSLPDYAKGTYDNDMVNAYINPEAQLKRRYTASHELFHILYKKYILNNDYSKRIVWYDEGMAQFMSGEKNYLDIDNNFEKFYKTVKENTNVIPNLNDIKHGNLFYNENYNGYDLSYLSIRYLYEIIGENEFKKLMHDFEKIKEIGNNIIYDMFSYYDEKINTIKNK